MVVKWANAVARRETTKTAGAGALPNSAPELVERFEAALGRLPAISAPLMAPIDVPMTQSGSIPLVQCLVDADLIGAQRAATLHRPLGRAGLGVGAPPRFFCLTDVAMTMFL
jgi:hypothetical protein